VSAAGVWFLTDRLGPHVEWVPVCPEVEASMGVPRPALRLQQVGSEPRMLEIESGRDHTRAMQRYARRRVFALRRLGLCGYVLKRGSPSCGMERVELYGDKGRPRKAGRGLYAAALLQALPWLQVEEEGRLSDSRLRENFIERVFACRRLRDLFAGRWTPGRVVEFHTAHELQLMAHSPRAYRELGRLVAGVKDQPRAEFRQRYEAGFMTALAKPATKVRNAKVLQHMAGTLHRGLDPEDRAELGGAIDVYRRGLVPLLVPLTLLRHHSRRMQVEYLLGQGYLEPHPRELMLRNHV
jgi:uncharacterized protein YbgA (DUF1722 family)/uncharacterized protein YbbK (DUF523 family)